MQEVHLSTPSGRDLFVPGYRHGHMSVGVHRPYTEPDEVPRRSGLWVLTHQRTGCAIIRVNDNLKTARRLARAIHRNIVYLGDYDTKVDFVRSRTGRVLRTYLRNLPPDLEKTQLHVLLTLADRTREETL